MNPNYYDSVIETFVRLYNKGLIYRGVRMVNWDPQGKTALSDEEVIYKDVQARLYYIAYRPAPPAPDGGAMFTELSNIEAPIGGLGAIIATTRPETIMADAAICVNPNDERYLHLHGKTVFIPLINREIPIILDEYVTMDFGTGCLKVTPAHDLNDYQLGIKHKLPVIDILNDDGTLNEKAQILVGEDRFAARKKIAKMLEEAGCLVKVEEYKSNVGTSERTGAVIEPKLSLQWFLKMEDMAKPALENVLNDNIKLVPPKFKNTYRAWMENVHDWCISRQLWWGQQIPAFYMQDGTVIVAKTKREALRKAQHEMQLFALTEEDLSQDPDVLDTWFSSWLWPIAVFDGIKNPDNEDINYYYPTNDLVTGPDILFFWVARMIMAGYEWRGELPFKNVYLTGIVRDKLGRKMSKQLGNSPDPLELIEKFGADGVRTGMLFSSAAGNDLLFDEKLCEQGRNFSNKIWNAFRFIKTSSPLTPNGGTVFLAPPLGAGGAVGVADLWFASKLNATIAEVHDHFEKFRVSDALQSIYKLIWDDFCGQYLEMIKSPAPPAPDGGVFVSSPIGRSDGSGGGAAGEQTIYFFEQLMQLAHPFMPFITEEIWQELRPRVENDSICLAAFPKAGGEIDHALLADFEVFFEVVTSIRNIRSTKGISPKIELPLAIKTDNVARYQMLEALLRKLANVSAIAFVADKAPGTSFVIKGEEFFVDLLGEIDMEAERENAQKELEYIEGFKKSVEAKLANERFVQNAKPELVEKERQKLADAEAKITALREMLART